MKFLTRILFAIALLCAIPTTSHAQIKIQYFSAVAKPAKQGQPQPSLPQTCIDAKKVLIDGLKAYPHPADWTFIIVCDEYGWDQVMKHIGLTGDDGQHYGETDLQGHLTYLRGPQLIKLADIRANGEHVIAHELCHIFLNSHDEYKVDKLADAWVAQHRADELAASRVQIARTQPDPARN